ncbi:MAG: MFS transporter [Clostridiales bacterium]|nr:MFS transporter [Clostridiales bacterium]
MTKDKLSRNAICLLGTNAVNSILYMFINTFLVAYFFTITNYDYKIISLYYFVSFIAIPLCFWLLGDVVKTKNKVWVYRAGIILYCIYILMIAFMKERIVEFYLPLGFFYGVVQGVFWVAGAVLINETVGEEKSSKKYITAKSIIGKICNIIFPIVFGASIEYTSFFYIAKIIIPLSVMQLIFSFFIKDKNKNKKEIIENFNIIKYIGYIKKNNANKVKTLYKIMFYEGIVNYLLATLITIVIVMTFKTTLNLGILTTIFSIFSIISTYVFKKVYKNKNPKKFIIVSAIILTLSVISLLFTINKTTVVIYNAVNSIFMILLINYAEMKRYNSAESYKEIKEKYLVEHQVVTETALGISRILGYFLLFVISILNNIIYFKILLVIVTICILLYAKELYKD